MHQKQLLRLALTTGNNLEAMHASTIAVHGQAARDRARCTTAAILTENEHQQSSIDGVSTGAGAPVIGGRDGTRRALLPLDSASFRLRRLLIPGAIMSANSVQRQRERC